jgi:N-acetylglucosaminyl-diphospho-decaprenol L-rhamnosyltransferase
MNARSVEAMRMPAAQTKLRSAPHGLQRSELEIGLTLMRLAVVTVNYCCAAEILQCAQATASQIAACEGQWWIVDNHSPDDSAAILRQALAHIPNAHLIEAPKNGGFGYGNNQVIDRILSGEIEAQYVYFLNPDAVPEPGSIAAMINYLNEHPSVAAVGSGLIDDGGTHTDSMFRFPSFLSEIESALAFGPVSRLLGSNKQSLGVLATAGPVDWVAGTSFMIRADVLRAVGGFDEGFFLYWEEVELCHRVARAGFEIHGLPSAKVRHVGGVSTGMHRPDRRLPAYWHRSRNLYFQKTRTGKPLALLNAVTALCLVGRRCLQFMKGTPMTQPRMLRDHVRHALGILRR